MKYRIGIDVGGTFTDAALINNENYELIDTVKMPTTHFAEEGVAAGIIQVLQMVMAKNHVKPEDVVFIAHGTTQATNALLEGDVVRVGIVTVGSGLEGKKSKNDTQIGDIQLTQSKNLSSENEYVDSSSKEFDIEIGKAIDRLNEAGCRAIVAAEAFSVDNAENENRVVNCCTDKNISGTATSEISKLYGLKVRTRTAVINASIMPKMLEAANMTEESIKLAGIQTPLMVMRCDGGVMTVDEVRKRPILTILSGPAAGVAGALMYEKLTDGIFLEVGGTSTDISCVKNGKVMVKYAEVGGHKTFLTSLDVRTVGIGGGSMIQFSDGRMTEVGPRSVHIAGMDYEVYADPAEIQNPVLKTIKPLDGDPEYAYVECSNGKKFALSLSGAANIAGYIKEGDYAKGNLDSAVKAWEPIAEALGITVEEAAKKALSLSAQKNGKVVKSLMEDYSMDPRTTELVGGGGGASTVVPALAEQLGQKSRNARNAPVISTIGVALAMIRDMVERTIPNPTDKDVINVRYEAIQKAIESGANPDTIEVDVEVDTAKNLVRAIAIGTSELRAKNMTSNIFDEEQLKSLVADNLAVGKEKVYTAAFNGSMYAMQVKNEEKKLFGLIKKVTTPTRIIDNEGVIRLQKINGIVKKCKAADWRERLGTLVESNAVYDDGGERLPNTYVILGKKIIDLCNLADKEQVMALASVELDQANPEDDLILLCSDHMD